MPILDWIFLGILLLSMLMGAWRGFVFEVLSVVSWVLAFFLAQWFALDAARWLPVTGASEPVRYAAGFVLVFILTIFAGGLIAFVVKKLLAVVGLSPADRLLGAVFGLVRGLLLLLAMTVVVQATPLRTQAWWQEATGPRWTSAALAGLKPVLPAAVGKYLP